MAANRALFFLHLALFFLSFGLLLVRSSSDNLSSTQAQSLLRLQKVLENPSILSNWTPSTDFCSIAPSSSLNISCVNGNVVGLQIVGDKGTFSPEKKLAHDFKAKLSDNFSVESLANTVLAFSSLEILSLTWLGIWGQVPGKLQHLSSLQVLNLSSNVLSGSIPRRLSLMQSLKILALDNNVLNGSFPDWVHLLPHLDTLRLSSNRLSGNIPANVSRLQNIRILAADHNLFNGSIPASMSHLQQLQYLSLASNHLSGDIPNLGGLKNLMVLNLGVNQLGPKFPTLNSQLQTLVLRQNKLSGRLPTSLSNFDGLTFLDLSSNSFTDEPPEYMFMLTSIQSLVLRHNRLSGVLPYNLSLSQNIQVLDLSYNLFTGALPQVFTQAVPAGRSIQFQRNCFSSKLQQQRPHSYCENILARSTKANDVRHVAIFIGIVAGAVVILVIISLLIVIKCFKQEKKQHGPASSCADTASVGVPSELLANARYISQSVRLGTLGTPHHRVYALEDIEAATANFSAANLIGEGHQGKVYKGRLDDGTVVVMKCLKIDPKQDMRQLKAHIDLLSKIRHRNLVSLLGHCLEREIDGQQCRRLYLVSEYVDNGTLRNHISKARGKEPLNWPRRLAAVISTGRGIQYLHTGVVPGIFNNNVHINNILLDQNYVAKLSDFGLGTHRTNIHNADAKLLVPKEISHIDLDHHHRKLASDKMDVYHFGHVLLEIILGRPPTTVFSKDLVPKIRELEMLMEENVPRAEVVDPAILGICVAESLTTVLDIAAKCVSADVSARPSMEDVLWNLQYAAQVQDRLSGDFQEEFPYASPPRNRFTKQVLPTSTSFMPKIEDSEK